MSGQPGTVEGQPRRPGRLPKPEALRRRRWFVQIGCLPFTCLLSGCLLLVVNLVFISNAPSWVTNPDEYLLGQRITGSLGMLAGLQLVGTWLLGVRAAAVAASAAAGQGGLLRQRLVILRRRVVIVAWAVFLLRLILLIALMISAALAYAYLADVRVAWNAFRGSPTIFGIETIVQVGALGILLIHWLIGPFLRLRYSMALGALAATWSRYRDSRAWLALTARMAAGLLGSLALLWGGTLGIFIVATIRQPFSMSTPIDFGRVLFPFLPKDSWSSIVFLLGLSAFILLYMMGQLALPPFYLWLARRRLAGKPRADARSPQLWGRKVTKEPSLPLVSEKTVVDG